MYLAGYIGGQYAANGGQIVANYPGSLLEKESGGAGPTSPAVGDVVSMDTTHVEGHTALVLANHVDASGNGYITVLQQNFSSNGTGTMDVVNGVLKSEESGYSASWLHDPRNDAPPSVSSLSGIANGGSYDGTVTVTGTAFAERQRVRRAPAAGRRGKFVSELRDPGVYLLQLPAGHHRRAQRHVSGVDRRGHQRNRLLLRPRSPSPSTTPRR